MPSGRWTNDELIGDLRSRQWLFDLIGEVLASYVQPARATKRPEVWNAIFLSLLWFHEACREPLDQIATTKFAASLDALACGGKSKGILKLIEARLGFKPDDRFMTDGRTTKAVIGQIYDNGRSRLIHGSSQDFAHDWNQSRKSAEVIGRHCLVEVCHLLSENAELVDPKGFSLPD